MEELFLDVSRDATRKHILQTLLAHLGDEGAKVATIVDAAGIPEKHHHNAEEVYTSIQNMAGVSNRVRHDMQGIYGILAEAEAFVHGCSVQETHFHEVGNASGIRNVAAICVGIDLLHPDRIVATPVQVGSGTVECAHGTLDIPAPATQAILSRGIPIAQERLEGELCTPTSAAILAYFVDEFAE